MALSFPNQKHSVHISVSCASNMMLLFYMFMDHLFQLLRNLNSFALFFFRKLSFISYIKYLKAKCLKALNALKCFPIFLGCRVCRPNYTSEALAVSSPVKIVLWAYVIFRSF